MTRVPLRHAIAPARKPIKALDLGQPRRVTIEAMERVRGPSGLSDADTIRFASRLSGHSIATIRKLRNDDLTRVKAALEALYAAARQPQASLGVAEEGGR